MISSRILLVVAALATSAAAQPITLTVRETTGLRRFGFPVTASMECGHGTVVTVDQLRLIDADNKEVPAQFTAMARWPDGSVRNLDVDFAPSPGPLETLVYHIEMGKGATPPVRARQSATGLSVTETPDEILVASAAIRHRIRPDGKPLVASFAFGENEFIGSDGIRTTLTPGPAEVLKRGPFNVTVKLGSVRLEYVNTKSWVKITQRAERSQDLAVDAHLNLAKLPLLWDFGAGSWLYGTLAKPDQVVATKHRNSAWDFITNTHTVFATTKTFDGCGHLADAERAAAFGVANAGEDVELQLTADGRVHVAAERDELTVYLHFVGQPIPVTAVTSPQAMTSPLEVTIQNP